jgi:hypothetical protein
VLPRLLVGPYAEKAPRLMAAMLEMTKIAIETLERGNALVRAE